jgi:hypothetical protein
MEKIQLERRPHLVCPTGFPKEISQRSVKTSYQYYVKKKKNINMRKKEQLEFSTRGTIYSLKKDK